jgi:D-beta-D-heptose 7-phosphate kinase/D-beta-D-heptose 1-phosphate adenosyltransferase
LVEALRPDVLIKGADYSAKTVAGGDVVIANGGRVFLARLLSDHSTTMVIDKVRSGQAAAQ